MTIITSDAPVTPGVDLRSLAKTMRERFSDGQRMAVRGSRIVHAVDKERWVHGELIPQPLCHTAVYGWSPDAYKAVRTPVTCMKCRRILARPEEILLPHGEFQPPLFVIPRQRVSDVA